MIVKSSINSIYIYREMWKEIVTTNALYAFVYLQTVKSYFYHIQV